MRIGIDLGGSKIEAIALDECGRQCWRQRIATPKGDYRGTIQAIAALLDRLERETGSSGSVGIGTPGSVSSVDGLMKNCNSTVLNGRALHADLTAALGREIRMANDADCLTLSEAVDGAGAGAHSVFGVILGTGVGGGLAVDRRLPGGANGICGEWGHNPLPGVSGADHQPRSCYCGRTDCIETWLSGPAFELSYARLSGRHLSAREISVELAAGERQAVACYKDYVDKLARALATVINIVDPYVIVLGGGISNIDALYRDVVSCWNQYVFSDRVDTRLLKAQHGDSSGVRGAAWLWPD